MALVRVTRVFSWPLRRFFDRRFEGVLQRVDAAREEASEWERDAHRRHQEMQTQVDQVKRQFEDEFVTLYRLLRADMDAANETVDLRTRALAQIAGSSEAVLEQLTELREAVSKLASRVDAQRQHADQFERRASDSP
jgi:uncharacterized protein YukE